MATIFSDWENFDVLDRGSLMGGGRTWMVDCILITKGALIIYLEGGLWWFWGGGVTLFPYYDLGGAVENSNENYIEHKGGPTIFWIC